MYEKSPKATKWFVYYRDECIINPSTHCQRQVQLHEYPQDSGTINCRHLLLRPPPSLPLVDAVATTRVEGEDGGGSNNHSNSEMGEGRDDRLGGQINARGTGTDRSPLEREGGTCLIPSEAAKSRWEFRWDMQNLHPARTFRGWVDCQVEVQNFSQVEFNVRISPTDRTIIPCPNMNTSRWNTISLVLLHSFDRLFCPEYVVVQTDVRSYL